MSSCFFTGVEHTGTITDKEVNRIITELETHQPASALTAYVDSLPSWRIGKRFYATDDQLRLLFERTADIDIDTIAFAGKYITYNGYETATSISGVKAVNIKFGDGTHNYTYKTSKSIDQFSPDFVIPLLVDMDMVEHVAAQIVGHEVYIKTMIWYSEQDDYLFRGRQYIPVKIVDVKPGNKVLPLKVVFETLDSEAQRAFVWISAPGATMHNRDFDSLFSLANPRNGYPDITDTRWKLITAGNVEEDMTKEECRLALGNPKRITPAPDQQGMREYWYYDGGGYLYFVDGLLKTFRR